MKTISNRFLAISVKSESQLPQNNNMLGKRVQPEVSGYWQLPNGLDDWHTLYQTADNLLLGFSSTTIHLVLPLPFPIETVYEDNTFLMNGVRYQFVQETNTLMDAIGDGYGPIGLWHANSSCFNEVDRDTLQEARIAAKAKHVSIQDYVREFMRPGLTLLDVFDGVPVYATNNGLEF
jgi:hypothetical protein